MQMFVNDAIVRVKGLHGKPKHFTLAVNCKNIVKDSVKTSYSDDLTHWVKCKVTTQSKGEVELHFDMDHYYEALILSNTIIKLRLNSAPDVKITADNDLPF